MNFLKQFLTYLPIAIPTVIAVEAAAKDTAGGSKRQVAQDIVLAIAHGAEKVPEEHAQVAGQVIDIIVSAMNNSGVAGFRPSPTISLSSPANSQPIRIQPLSPR